MSKKAKVVLIEYDEDQHSPSRPKIQEIDLSNPLDFFVALALDYFNDEPIEITGTNKFRLGVVDPIYFEVQEENCFGDLTISLGYGSHAYVTFDDQEDKMAVYKALGI